MSEPRQPLSPSIPPPKRARLNSAGQTASTAHSADYSSDGGSVTSLTRGSETRPPSSMAASHAPAPSTVKAAAVDKCALPEGWKECSRMAPPLQRCKFIPFKVTISNPVLDNQLDAVDKFTPSNFFDYQISKKRSVGMVVDATVEGALRGYNNELEWESAGAKLVRVDVDPRGIPSRQQIATFVQTAKTYFADEPEGYIGVFSENWYNTPGLLCVCFMVEALGLTLEHALREFSATREPGLYSRVHLDFLCATYQQVPRSPNYPRPPHWDTRAMDLFKEKIRDSASPMPPSSPFRARLVPPPSPRPMVPLFDRSLERSPCPSASPARSTVSVQHQGRYPSPAPFDTHNPAITMAEQLMQGGETDFATVLGGRDAWVTPGCTDVHASTHVVSWCPSGQKYLLLFTQRGVFVIDKDRSVTKVHVHCPRVGAANEVLDKTLLVGTLVSDIDRAGHEVRRFLVEDIIAYEGKNLGGRTLSKRLGYIQHLLAPRKQDSQYDYNTDSFHLRMKEFFKLDRTEYLVNKFLGQLTHENEGLVFCHAEAPYDNVAPMYRWRRPDPAQPDGPACATVDELLAIVL